MSSVAHHHPDTLQRNIQLLGGDLGQDGHQALPILNLAAEHGDGLFRVNPDPGIQFGVIEQGCGKSRLLDGEVTQLAGGIQRSAFRAGNPQVDRPADALMGAAATQIPVESLVDLLVSGIADLVEQPLSGDHQASGAVPTLGGLLVDKGFLQRVKAIGRAQTLDGDDQGRADFADFELAGRDRFAIDQDIARPALLRAAGVFGAFEAELVAEDVQQRGFRIDLYPARFPVDVELKFRLHGPHLS